MRGQGTTSSAAGPQLHRKNYHTCEGQGRTSVAAQVHSCIGKITIRVRDKEDFRCSRSTAERKITIHVMDRGGLQVQQVHSCTGKNTIHVRER
jgi:hypothetical protein